MGEPPEVVVGRHRRACRGFSAVVEAVPADAWDRPTPCSAWDAGALVEHVVGFHEFLLLRPLGVRAHRPRTGPAARWAATELATDEALDHPELSQQVGYFDGDRHRPVDLLGAITGDVLIHTWDLARSVGAPERLDGELCRLGLDAARASVDAAAGSAMFSPPVTIGADASPQDHLLALRGRDPGWRPPNPR